MKNQKTQTLKLALTELWFFKKELFLSLIVLGFGMSSLLFAIGFKGSAERFTLTQAKSFLTADLLITSNQDFPKDYQHPQPIKRLLLSEATETQLLTNLRTEDWTALVDLRALTPEYPLIGNLETAPGQLVKMKDLSPGSLWLPPSLFGRLKNKSSSLYLGEHSFTLAGKISKDPTVSRFGTGIAEKVYIRAMDLEKTQLTKGVGQRSISKYLKLDRDLTPEEYDLAQEELLTKGINLRSPKQQLRRLSRSLDYFGQYLALLSSLSLLVALIIASYLLQVFFRRRAQSQAILQIFGATRKSLNFKTAIQVFGCFSLSSLMALILIFMSFRLAGELLSDSLPQGFLLQIGQRDFLVFVTCFFGMALALTFAQIYLQKKESLLEKLQSSSPVLVSSPRGLILHLFVSLACIVILVTFLDRFRTAFALSLYCCLSILFSFYGPQAFFSWISRRLPGIKGPELRWTLTGLSRFRPLVGMAVLALSQLAFVFNVFPHLEVNFQKELQVLKDSNLPSLFAFNIQKERLPELTKEANLRDAQLLHESPLIQGRWIGHNGQEPKNKRYKTFPVRLTYNKELKPSESMLSGQPFTEGDFPELSVETDFARENEVKIGDQLEFSLGGLTETFRVQNFRKINWQSFQPNFFFQARPRDLDGFPKSYVAVIVSEKTDPAAQAQLALGLSQFFSDVSFIDVRKTVGIIQELSKKLSLPLRISTALGLLGLWLILMFLYQHQLKERAREWALIRLMGSSKKSIRKFLSWEALLLGLTISIWGVLTGLVLSQVLVYWVFERKMIPAWGPMLSSVLVLSGSLVLVSFFYRLSPIKIESFQSESSSE